MVGDAKRRRKRKRPTAAQLAHRKRQVAKKRKRNARERALAKKIRALPDKHYGVILADPPWRFEPYSRETGLDRAADNHYPCQCETDIYALEVSKIAAQDCVLFLWATAPMLNQALIAMQAAWGFHYKTHAVWDKFIAGTGYWFRGRHELLLIGTRGHPPAPAQGTQPDSLLCVRRRRHSEKPVQVHELIESWYPNLPKIELYARTARVGWDRWGAEADGGSCNAVQIGKIDRDVGLAIRSRDYHGGASDTADAGRERA